LRGRNASRNGLATLSDRIVNCSRCPRLISHCLNIARTRRRAYIDEAYWGRPVPGFGDSEARVLVVGLAPGAHGANRTGRMFTGDGAGQTLAGALHRAGFASQPSSLHSDDGLVLRDLYVTASVRCAPPDNRPLPEEIDRCLEYLVAELRLLRRVRVVVALGAVAHQTFLRAAAAAGASVPRPRPRFGHGAQARIPWPGRAVVLIDSYHPSRQNTQTRRLTSTMLEAVFLRARTLASSSPVS
jgi:uracil-DNA glycosylase family 4